MQRILTALHQEGLIDICLPFDLDRAFACSFVAVLLTVVYPNAESSPTLYGESLAILDSLIARGSKPATYRKAELLQLNNMIATWYARHGANAPVQVQELSGEAGSEVIGLMYHSTEREGLGSGGPLSPEQLMSLADMLPEPSTISNNEWMDSWLWS